MPAERRYGMDHEHYDWWPLVKRGMLRWPDDARVALCVIVTLEHLEWRPPEGSYYPSNIAGSSGSIGGPPERRPHPDILRFSLRDYGHRVGIFRVLDVLQKHGIRVTIAMDQLTAENYPYLVKHCVDRGCEFIGHGVAVTRMITSRMAEAEEREYIRLSLASLRKATGIEPIGWLGPEYGESIRTPQVLAEAGILYVCDWVNDEQPYPMKTSKGTLYALPITLGLDDIIALWNRKMPVDRYERLLKECFEALWEDGVKNGRVLVLNLHPWLIGQPYAINYLDSALAYMIKRQSVWRATGSEIIDWYSKHSPIK
jgi:allantoinase